MGLDQMLDDRESETGPALGARPRLVSAIKPFENTREVLEWYTGAIVDDTQGDAALHWTTSAQDTSTSRGVAE
jgi:hypothetical protein